MTKRIRAFIAALLITVGVVSIGGSVASATVATTKDCYVHTDEGVWQYSTTGTSYQIASWTAPSGYTLVKADVTVENNVGDVENPYHNANLVINGLVFPIERDGQGRAYSFSTPLSGTTLNAAVTSTDGWSSKVTIKTTKCKTAPPSSLGLTYNQDCVPDPTNTWRVRPTGVTQPTKWELFQDGVSVGSGSFETGATAEQIVEVPRKQPSTAILKWDSDGNGSLDKQSPKASGPDLTAATAPEKCGPPPTTSTTTPPTTTVVTTTVPPTTDASTTTTEAPTTTAPESSTTAAPTTTIAATTTIPESSSSVTPTVLITTPHPTVTTVPSTLPATGMNGGDIGLTLVLGVLALVTGLALVGVRRKSTI
jgi:hypothetical protein